MVKRSKVLIDVEAFQDSGEGNEEEREIDYIKNSEIESEGEY